MFYILSPMAQAHQYIAPSLFPDLDTIPQPRRPKSATGGSGNPIVFHDYESYIAKFRDVEKTTDDTYTPRDVYEAVCQYVDETVGLAGHHQTHRRSRYIIHRRVAATQPLPSIRLSVMVNPYVHFAR